MKTLIQKIEKLRDDALTKSKDPFYQGDKFMEGRMNGFDEVLQIILKEESKC